MNNPDIAAITERNISIINCEKTTPTRPITDRNIPNTDNNDFFTILKIQNKEILYENYVFFQNFFVLKKKTKVFKYIKYN